MHSLLVRPLRVKLEVYSSKVTRASWTKGGASLSSTENLKYDLPILWLCLITHFSQKIFITLEPTDGFLPPIKYQFHLGDISSVHVSQERVHKDDDDISLKVYELTLTLIARRPARISIREHEDRFRRATDMDFNLLGQESNAGVISPIPEGIRAFAQIHVSTY